MSQGTSQGTSERTYKNVLWIDPAVRDYQVFVDSVNADTLAIVYPDPLTGLQTGVERIGFVFELHGPMATYLLSNASVLIGSGVKHMDFLACDTLPEWQGFYDTLTGIKVGASNNKTGNLKYGGDWLMESTCEDVEAIYFSKSIEYYKYLLVNSHSTMFLDFSGNLWGCGNNNEGQLGLENTNNVTIFFLMRSNVFYFDAAIWTTCVIDFSGNLWGCGYNGTGGLGLGNTNRNVTNFSFMRSNIASVACGIRHTIALDNSGNLYGCGSNNNGELALGYANNTPVTNFYFMRPNVASIAAGGYHTLAIDNSGRLYGCGKNSNGQLGLENTNSVTTFYFMRSNVASFAAGTEHTVALDNSGNLWGCGMNEYGQLGLGNTYSPVTNFSLMRSNVASFDTGSFHTLALDFSGNLWGCGYNLYGQLGQGNTTNVTNFSFMRSNVSSLRAGRQHTNILDNSGNLWGCGLNEYGQLGLGNQNTSVPNFSFMRSGVLSIRPIKNNTIRITTIEKNAAFINSSVNLLGYNFSTNNTSYLMIGNTSVDISVLDTRTIQFRVPNVPQVNASVDLYTNIGALRLSTAFTILPFFNLTGYTPSSVIPRTRLQLFGSNFFDISYVRFGETPVFPTSVSSTQINVSVPIGLDDQVTVTVFDLYGNNSALPNLSVLNMRVTTFAPSGAPQKSTIFLSGSNFSNLSTVRFGAINASFTRLSDTNLSTRVPDGITQNCSVGVWDIFGNNASYPDSFTNTTFNVSTFAPTSGPKRSTVLLTGSNFSNISEVRFGTFNASFEYTLPNLSVRVPDGILLNSSVRVWDIYGNNFSYPGNFTNTTFTVTTFTPITTIQKRTIKLIGANFSNISEVWFGTVPSPQVIWTSATNLSVVVPDRTQLTCAVRVVDVYGNNVTYGTNFTYADSLLITSIPNAPQKSNVVIVGTNFSNISAVLFSGPTGSINANFRWMSALNISVRIPDGIPVNASVGVWDIFGNNSSTSFTNTTFTIQSLDQSAPQKSMILLSGTNISNMSSVRFGTVNASFTRISDTNLSARVPDGIPLNCSLGIWDIYGNNVSLNFVNTTFTIDTTPLSAPRKSTITLTGTNLSNLAVVRFGTVNAIFENGSNLSVRVPDGIPLNCSIGVLDLYGNNASVSFVDTTFTLTQFSPTVEFKKGLMNLSGANFSNMSAVLFTKQGDSLNASFTWNSSANLLAEVPSVVTNCSIDVQDIYGNILRYPATFTVTNLSYAFQVLDRLTLVGTGLTGLGFDLGLMDYTSSTAPMFRATRQGTINLSRNELVTDTVPIYPVTVIQSFDKEVVTVRGLPYGKIPDQFGVYSG